MKYHLHYPRSPFSLIKNFFHHTPANQDDSDFLNSLIHELKAPLNAVVHSKEINNAALDLSELIHDLLDVGSGQSENNFSVNLRHEVNIAEIIKRSVRLNHSYALKKHIKIESEIAADLKPARLDDKRMKQILANLLSNALKYSAENTVVKVVAENNGDSLEIKVIDQGFGMRPDEVARAFNKYQVIDDFNPEKADSFGPDLPITKQLVELQNGKIEIKSEVGKGTEVKLIFPCCPQELYSNSNYPAGESYFLERSASII